MWILEPQNLWGHGSCDDMIGEENFFRSFTWAYKSFSLVVQSWEVILERDTHCGRLFDL
jgi:hypothetical protein